MLRRFLAIALACVVIAQEAFAAAPNQMVTIVAVNKVQWTTGTSKTIKKEHGGRHAGSAAAGLYFLGPVGALAGYAISKGMSEDDEDVNTSDKQTITGFQLKLNNGETVRTLVKYKVGQRLRRGDIDEDL